MLLAAPPKLLLGVFLGWIMVTGAGAPLLSSLSLLLLLVLEGIPLASKAASCDSRFLLLCMASSLFL